MIDMNKLKLKMIIVAFVSSILVFSVMALGVCLTIAHYNSRQADATTSLISLNGGVVPSVSEFSQEDFKDRTKYRLKLDDEAMFRTRYFIINLDSEDNITDIQSDHISSINSEDAEVYSADVLGKPFDVGYYNEYRYRVVNDDSTGGRFIVFLDCTEVIASQNAMVFRTSIWACLFAIVLTLIFSAFSNRIIEPFEANERMQKQFITDASHELKTPLAVISANAEVLKYKNGDNEWIENITSQSKRMAKLIDQLLVLSRMDEVGENAVTSEVDLSAVTENSVSKLKGIFEQKEVDLKTDIEPGIVINANREQMETLTDILIENASKYVTEKGKAGVSLTTGGKKAVLSIYNSASDTDDMDCDKIFERFYRTDESRTSSTGGHGIGLSIAKRIVEQHNGRIKARIEEDTVVFRVELPEGVKRNENDQKKLPEGMKRNENDQKK